jgi:hypothetical protein
VKNSDPPKFLIRDWHGTRMIWRVEDRKIICLEGHEFLASDPYAEKVASP